MPGTEHDNGGQQQVQPRVQINPTSTVLPLVLLHSGKVDFLFICNFGQLYAFAENYEKMQRSIGISFTSCIMTSSLRTGITWTKDGGNTYQEWHEGYYFKEPVSIKYYAMRTLLSEQEDLEVERELKQLNKPARKSITDVDGSIYDCVDIDKQPAFDHPLLRNHKIRRPGISPQGTHNQTLPSFDKHVKIGIEGEECPEGTIIIRRTRKEELLWAKNNPPSVAFRNSNHPNTAREPGRHFAISVAREASVKYYGVSALFNVYQPYCKPLQLSAGSMWFEAGSEAAFDSVQTGWMVNPLLFGDDLSHLFGAWSTRAEGKQDQGCYNMLCQGFVQISTKYTFGRVLKASEFDKDYQAFMQLRISRAAVSGDWWLGISEDNELIGYWPKELFTLMTDHGTLAAWGGQAHGPPNDSPPMGSGHYGTSIPHASMVGLMQVVNEQDNLVDVTDPAVSTYSTSPKCYGLHYWHYTDPTYRRSMFFGGEGGDSCEKQIY